MEQADHLKIMLGGFIAILVGVVLLGPIADSIVALDVTERLANNESLTWVGNNTPITLANNDLVAGSDTVYNQTNKLTRNTDYTITRSAITFTNISIGIIATETGALNITYTHEGNEYVADNTSKRLLSLTIIFFAIAIMSLGFIIVIKSYNAMQLD